jgi:ABC-type transport system involved in Fe-S cluster assembly fused permease/ATPase subunit
MEKYIYVINCLTINASVSQSKTAGAYQELADAIKDCEHLIDSANTVSDKVKAKQKYNLANNPYKTITLLDGVFRIHIEKVAIK